MSIRLILVKTEVKASAEKERKKVENPVASFPASLHNIQPKHGFCSSVHISAPRCSSARSLSRMLAAPGKSPTLTLSMEVTVRIPAGQDRWSSNTCTPLRGLTELQVPWTRLVLIFNALRFNRLPRSG